MEIFLFGASVHMKQRGASTAHQREAGDNTSSLQSRDLVNNCISGKTTKKLTKKVKVTAVQNLLHIFTGPNNKAHCYQSIHRESYNGK